MKINFIKYHLLSFSLSGIGIVTTLLFLLFFGLNLGIDFTGGTIVEVSSNDPSVDTMKVKKMLANSGFKSAFVQHFSDNGNYLIKVRGVESEEIRKVFPLSEFQYHKTDYVGAQVGLRFLQDSCIALVCALLGVFLYLCVRFNLEFSLSGIISLVHDCVLSIGFIAVSQIEFNLPSVVALLTIIGYSINDSVVIFDRIREYIGDKKCDNLHVVANDSINSTLSRTVFTSFTTMLAALPLMIFDYGTVREFSAIIFFGIVVGTYSSIFISAPLFVKFKQRKNNSC